MIQKTRCVHDMRFFKETFYQERDKTKVLKDLQEVEYYLLITNMWSAASKMEPYLAMTTLH